MKKEFLATVSAGIFLPLCLHGQSQEDVARAVQYIDQWALKTFSARMVQTGLILKGCKPEELGQEFGYVASALSSHSDEPFSVQVSTWAEGRFAAISQDRLTPLPVLSMAYYWDGSRLIVANNTQRAVRFERRFSTQDRFWPHSLFGIYGVTPLSAWLMPAQSKGTLRVEAGEIEGEPTLVLQFPCKSLALGARLEFETSPEMRLRRTTFSSLANGAVLWDLEVTEWTECSGQPVPRVVHDVYGLPRLPTMTRKFNAVVDRELTIEWKAGVTCDGGAVLSCARAMAESVNDEEGTYINTSGYGRRIAEEAQLIRSELAPASLEQDELLPTSSSHVGLIHEDWEDEANPSWPHLDSGLVRSMHKDWFDMSAMGMGWCGQASLAMTAALLRRKVYFEQLYATNSDAEITLNDMVALGTKFGIPLRIVPLKAAAEANLMIVPIGKSPPFHVGVALRKSRKEKVYSLWQPPFGTQDVEISRLSGACALGAALILSGESAKELWK